MNDIQKQILEKVKNDWARCGCVYKNIIEINNI